MLTEPPEDNLHIVHIGDGLVFIYWFWNLEFIFLGDKLRSDDFNADGMEREPSEEQYGQQYRDETHGSRRTKATARQQRLRQRNTEEDLQCGKNIVP